MLRLVLILVCTVPSTRTSAWSRVVTAACTILLSFCVRPRRARFKAGPARFSNEKMHFFSAVWWVLRLSERGVYCLKWNFCERTIWPKDCRQWLCGRFKWNSEVIWFPRSLAKLFSNASELKWHLDLEGIPTKLWRKNSPFHCAKYEKTRQTIRKGDS